MIEHIIGQPADITIANKRHDNISDQLFRRRKLATEVPGCPATNNQNHNYKSQACKRPRCMTCNVIVERNDGRMLVNGQQCKLDMKLKCSDTNLIYVAQCKHCKPGFYFGQTWCTLSERMNKHRANFKIGQYSKSALSEHIYSKHSDKMSDKLDNFSIGIVLQCNRDDLNMYEDIYIEKYNARIIGLNRCKVNGN